MERAHKGLRKFWESLGPGLITGAADDDPSGIATYSIAGAQLGTGMLWAALFTWPLMAAVQMMCARIGMVTGMGLAGALKRTLPSPILTILIFALLFANTINVGADLAGMADAAEMLSGINSHFYVILFGLAISVATVKLRYHQIANTLKWLALVLFAYVITGFIIGPNWHTVFRSTFIPAMPKGKAAWETLVAILGTTISPYLFFWQASEEVEEEKAMGRNTLDARKGATEHEIRTRNLDVGIGTFFSNVIMFFIILTTAFTLNRHGITNIETSRQAAEALKPLAGRFAATIFTLGVVGVGFLAIPTLTCSAAYAFAETYAWRHGLDKKLKGARSFYGVILASMVLGIVLDFTKISPLKALYWTAVINGVLAPFLLIGILLVAHDTNAMCQQPSSRLGWVVVLIATVAMFVAAVAMFVV